MDDYVYGYNFTPKMVPKIIGVTIKSILSAFPSHTYPDGELADYLKTVLEGYVRRDSDIKIPYKTSDQRSKMSPLLGKQASAYAAAGIDIASASPLLMMMAASAAQGKQLQPSNLQSGKRIGRSIHSEKAARRMEVYIQEKGITQTQFSVAVNADPKTLYRFRRTSKVEKSVATRIATAMGITLEQFTA